MSATVSRGAAVNVGAARGDAKRTRRTQRTPRAQRTTGANPSGALASLRFVSASAAKSVALLVGVTAALLVLLALVSIVPIRAYQGQRREIDAGQDRLTMLRDRNANLESRVAQLRTDTEMQRVAREQFRMVKPGERVVLMPGVLPSGAVDEQDMEQSPAPSASETPPPSRARAILDSLTFWR